MVNVKEKYEEELPQIMLDFLIYCNSASEMKSEHTIKNYACDLKKWFKYQFSEDMTITADNISKLELIDLDRFIGSLEGKSANTVLRVIATIKSFYRYLVRYNIIKNNISHDIATPKKPHRNPKFLSIKEITKLFRVFDRVNTRYPERDKAMITMFLGTGMRLSELVNIRKSDIKEGVVRVVGKGNKERFIPLADKVNTALKDYLSVSKNNSGDVLFVNERNDKFDSGTVSHLVKRYLDEAGLKGFSTHKLRHTAATHWYANGTDIREIQELLGHSSVSTTEMYTHTSKDKRKIVNNIRW
jgi:integrase/recombinase XerD